MLNRRQMIGRSALGVGGFAAVAAFGKCSKANVEVEVTTAVTFLGKVASLLPGKAGIIGKITGALGDFNKFYQAGDFSTAGAFFASVDADFTQLIADVGVNLNPSVKIALALVDAAISAIAVLVKSHAPVSAKIALTAEQQAAVDAVERRAAKAEKLFNAIQ